MTVEQRLPAAGDAVDRRQRSANQEFFRDVDRGDELGPFGSRLLIVAGWSLHGRT